MKKRIFILEDHADTARGLKRYLEALGYAVFVADTVLSGRKLANEASFDVLVCDLNLPDGTGWDFLEWLSKKRSVCAIAMSGWASEQDVARSKATGFFAHLTKPMIPGELAEAIQRVLAMTRQLSSREATQRPGRCAGPNRPGFIPPS